MKKNAVICSNLKIMLKVEIIGNLGADATSRANDKGKYLTFDIAHTDYYRDANGERVERTDWVSCSYNGGERVAEYLKKGVKVFARGRLSVRTYRSNSGEWRAGLQCFVDELVLCGTKTDNNNGDAPF